MNQQRLEMEILKVENVTKTFQLDGQEINALKNVSFSIGCRRHYRDPGPIGVRKKHPLTLLGGLSSPSEGKVYCRNHSLYDMEGDLWPVFETSFLVLFFNFTI